ncbi:MAG TPA: DUF4157 domain-containing protein, partial [Terracidiphilus sp.]
MPTSSYKQRAPGRTEAAPETSRSPLSAALRPLPTSRFAGNQAALRRLSRTSPRVQPKLEIGAVDDPLEAEADRAAAHVMRMPASQPSQDDTASVLRRKCASCEKEEKIHPKSAPQPGNHTAGEGQAPPIVEQALNSPGQPLDATTRAFFEPRFGADFRGVRVHSDSVARDSAGAVNALAYAARNHIVLGSSANTGVSPLLAHELAHVVQQDAAPTSNHATAENSIHRAPDPQAGQATAAQQPDAQQQAGQQAAAQKPTDCETGDPVFTPGDTFRFFINTDTWKGGADAGLLDTIQQYKDDTLFVIDGFASTEGPKDFNAALSCKRALKAKALMMAAGVAESRITHVIGHGATPGNVDDRRSIVIHPIPPPTPQQPRPDTKQQDTKQPDDAKKKDEANKDDTKKDDAKKDQNTPTDPNAAQPSDPNPRLVIQIPLSLVNISVPFGKPGGVGQQPPGQRDPALDESYQPNVAFGFNYAFRNDPIGPQLGAFAQFGANVPLHLGDARPHSLSGVHTSFTGLNLQGYLQPSYVVYSSNGWTL